MRIFLYLSIVFVISFSSCLKKEEPIVLPAKNLASHYEHMDCRTENENMLFYDFSTAQKYTASNKEWMLAFDAALGRFNVRINHSILGRQFYESTDTSFNVSAKDIIKSGIAKMDSLTSWTENTAIGDWYRNGFPSNKTYLYHIEADIFGNGEHQYKFKLMVKNDHEYQIKFMDEKSMDKTIHYFTLAKDNRFNFNYFSFDEKGKALNIEPLKENWDIVLTQYRDMVVNVADGKLYPYQVLGVLINPLNTLVHRITINDFEKVDFAYCKNSALCNISNLIGYDWKSYDIALAKYTINDKIAWILKDNENTYHKFRFISYYNNKGMSGYPTFEYVSFK